MPLCLTIIQRCLPLEEQRKSSLGSLMVCRFAHFGQCGIHFNTNHPECIRNNCSVFPILFVIAQFTLQWLVDGTSRVHSARCGEAPINGCALHGQRSCAATWYQRAWRYRADPQTSWGFLRHWKCRMVRGQWLPSMLGFPTRADHFLVMGTAHMAYPYI